MTTAIRRDCIKFRLRYSVTILTIGPQIGQKGACFIKCITLITQ